MTVPLTGAEGLFVRLGTQAAALNSTNTFRGTTLPGAFDAVLGDFESAEQNAVSDIWSQYTNFPSVNSSWQTYLSGLATTTIVKMVRTDADEVADRSLLYCLGYVKDQMLTNSESITRPTVTAVVTPDGSNVGDTKVVASVTDNDGLVMPYPYSENVAVTVTADYLSGATAYREPASVVGQPAASDVLASTWPDGSGVNTSVTTADASQNGLLTDGDFESWTNTNTPTNWPIAVGTAGTTILRSTTALGAGTYALSFVGDGSQLTGVYQSVSLTRQTVYAACVWVRKSGTVSAGVLRMALTDGSGTVVNDDAGNAISVSVPYTDLTTSYAPVTLFIRVPFVPPSTMRLSLSLTTAVTAAGVVLMDRACVVAATRLYNGGPYLALFSGGQKAVVGDNWTVAVANNHTVTNFTRALDRVFGLRGLVPLGVPAGVGFKFPQAASGTISDDLIVIS
jgi:hypothetical protein